MFTNEASTMVSGQSPIGATAVSLNDMIRLVRVQAMVRGFLQRRRYKFDRMYSDNTSRYFKQEEAQETLTDQVFKLDGELEVREYEYKTGSVYNGEWLGGMRHGQGKMVWADNGCYEGKWLYN